MRGDSNLKKNLGSLHFNLFHSCTGISSEYLVEYCIYKKAPVRRFLFQTNPSKALVFEIWEIRRCSSRPCSKLSSKYPQSVFDRPQWQALKILLAEFPLMVTKRPFMLKVNVVRICSNMKASSMWRTNWSTKKLTGGARGRYYSRLNWEPHIYYWITISYSYHKTKCPARAQTENDQIIKLVHEHSHISDASSIEAKAIRSQIKSKALSTEDCPRKVIGKLMSQAPDAVIAKLPSVSNLAHSVSRYRRKEEGGTKDPSNLAELVLDVPHQLTTKGEMFLLHDIQQPDGRTMIFATKENLRFLSNCSHWYMDGTFKIAPKLFTQLYSIHGISWFLWEVSTLYCWFPFQENALVEFFHWSMQSHRIRVKTPTNQYWKPCDILSRHYVQLTSQWTSN